MLPTVRPERGARSSGIATRCPRPRSIRPLLAGLLLVAPTLAACGCQGPTLAGYTGLAGPIESYYEGRAMEDNARCPLPRIDATVSARIVEETPERVVMRIGYHWTDENQTVELGNGGSLIVCSDWGERTFTFDRAPDGTLVLAGMGGLQKRS
jgi:hypothetical protein